MAAFGPNLMTLSREKWDHRNLTGAFKALAVALSRALKGIDTQPSALHHAPVDVSAAGRSIQSLVIDLTPAELEAELLDSGDLEGYYHGDERDVALFDGLRYSSERCAWVARFVPRRPELTSINYTDDTYDEVLRRAKILHTCLVRPSQSFKALTAFDVRLDRAVAKLSFPEP